MLRRSLATHSFVGPRQLWIEKMLTEKFAPVAHLQVLNESHGVASDESHFKVVIVSNVFEEQKLIARHRMVNAALSQADGSLEFHSLSVGAAKTVAEWGEKAMVPPSPGCVGGDGAADARENGKVSPNTKRCQDE
jgi:BolA protein